MKLIDAVVAEIEKIRAKWFGINNDFSDGQKVALTKVLSLIDTLEVKEVDLNREMQAFAFLYLEPLKISDSNIGISITMAQLYRCAKHFFELGIKAQKGE